MKRNLISLAVASAIFGAAALAPVPAFAQSAEIEALKAQLAIAETRLTELSSNYGSNHPQRQAVEAQVRELRQQVAAEVRRVSGGSSSVRIVPIAKRSPETPLPIDALTSRLRRSSTANDSSPSTTVSPLI